ncbi:MAG: hypothetical protein IJT82_05620 [Schwartzia sp.]|nr:hypothetical protein [Schwartzia sp. (in: firmicutes)]
MKLNINTDGFHRDLDDIVDAGAEACGAFCGAVATFIFTILFIGAIFVGISYFAPSIPFIS